MRVSQDGAFRYGLSVSAAQAEGEPVANGVSHGVSIASGDEPVLVIADDLLELALSSSLRSAATSPDDSLAAGLVADCNLSDPSLPGGVPEQAAVTFYCAAWSSDGLSFVFKKCDVISDGRGRN